MKAKATNDSNVNVSRQAVQRHAKVCRAMLPITSAKLTAIHTATRTECTERTIHRYQLWSSPRCSCPPRWPRPGLYHPGLHGHQPVDWDEKGRCMVGRTETHENLFFLHGRQSPAATHSFHYCSLRSMPVLQEEEPLCQHNPSTAISDMVWRGSRIQIKRVRRRRRRYSGGLASNPTPISFVNLT